MRGTEIDRQTDRQTEAKEGTAGGRPTRVDTDRGGKPDRGGGQGKGTDANERGAARVGPKMGGAWWPQEVGGDVDGLST